MPSESAAPEGHLAATSGDGCIDGGRGKSTASQSVGFPGSAQSAFAAGRAHTYRAHPVSFGDIWGDWSWQPGRAFQPPPLQADSKNRNADQVARSCACGAPISRSNQRFCSARCKQAAYRQRGGNK